jgi:hypothetical protein
MAAASNPSSGSGYETPRYFSDPPPLTELHPASVLISIDGNQYEPLPANISLFAGIIAQEHKNQAGCNIETVGDVENFFLREVKKLEVRTPPRTPSTFSCARVAATTMIALTAIGLVIASDYFGYTAFTSRFGT